MMLMLFPSVCIVSLTYLYGAIMDIPDNESLIAGCVITGYLYALMLESLL